MNRDATRQEMCSYVCGQCHVEYYFDRDDNEAVTCPWSEGLGIDEIDRDYDVTPDSLAPGRTGPTVPGSPQPR